MRNWFQSLPIKDGDIIEGINGFTIVRGDLPDYTNADFEPAKGVMDFPASDSFYAFLLKDGETVIIQEGEMLDFNLCELEDYHFKIATANVAFPLELTIGGRAVEMCAFVPPSLDVFEYLDSLCRLANMGLGLNELANLQKRRDGYEKMVTRLKAQFGDAFDINKLKEISDDEGSTVFHYEVE